MKLTLSLLFILTLFSAGLTAQTKRRAAPRPKAPETKKAIVIDERLAVLRLEPGFYARPVQRMRRGRELVILGSKQADGVTFYRVSLPPKTIGWVQAEAVIGASDGGDDDIRLARLVQASAGFDQIERAALFLENFPDSPLRPPILLLVGDLLEEIALKLSKAATRQFDRQEMAASGAPLHSFYLNYAGLDRYRRLGLGFYFHVGTKSFHYDGAAWRELVKKFPNTPEAGEAQKRLDGLREKMAN